MELVETSKCLAELGHEKRLAIYRYLVRMGKNGVTVGSIQEELNIPASTLSHHISRLTQVGLVEQKREGTALFCSPQYNKLQNIISFLVEECCEGSSCIEQTKCCT